MARRAAEEATQQAEETTPPLAETLQTAVPEPVMQPQADQVPGLSGLADAFASGGRVFASAGAGEIELGSFSPVSLSGAAGKVIPGAGEAAGKLAEQTGQILSPFRTILSGVKSFFSGLKEMMKNPKQAIPALLFGAVWIILGTQRGSDSGLVKALSWLTCSEGGLDRSLLGAVGGTFGKGTVAVALSSLFSGGFRDTLRGFRSLFSRGGEKRSLVSAVTGALLGGLCSLFFTGTGATAGASSMAGISGALLSLQALGNKDSFLARMAASLTSRVTGGRRLPQKGKETSLLSGMAVGFAAVTAVAAFL